MFPKVRVSVFLAAAIHKGTGMARLWLAVAGIQEGGQGTTPCGHTSTVPLTSVPAQTSQYIPTPRALMTGKAGWSRDRIRP